MKNIKLSLKHIYALMQRAKISQICHISQEYFSDCIEIHTHQKISPRSLRLGLAWFGKSTCPTSSLVQPIFLLIQNSKNMSMIKD